MDVYEFLVGLLALIITLCGLAFMFYCFYKIDRNKKEYINNLNEHDKSVIMDFIACEWSIFKKKGEKK